MANSQASMLCTLCLTFLRLLNGSETIHWTALTMTYLPLLVLWGTLQKVEPIPNLSSACPIDSAILTSPATVGFTPMLQAAVVQFQSLEP